MIVMPALPALKGLRSKYRRTPIKLRRFARQAMREAQIELGVSRFEFCKLIVAGDQAASEALQTACLDVAPKSFDILAIIEVVMMIIQLLSELFDWDF